MTELEDVWQTVRAQAGHSNVWLHDLRHFFASRALALGKSLPKIGKLIGHAQVETTAHYAHLFIAVLTFHAVYVAPPQVSNQSFIHGAPPLSEHKNN